MHVLEYKLLNVTKSKSKVKKLSKMFNSSV